MSASTMKTVVAPFVEKTTTTSYCESSDVEDEPIYRMSMSTTNSQSKNNKSNKTNNNNVKNNNINNGVYYQQHSFDVPSVVDAEQGYYFVHDTELMTELLEQSPVQTLLRKSHSYSGTIRPKATIIKQDSLNGRIATSLTADNVPNLNSAAFYLDAHAKQCQINAQHSENNSSSRNAAMNDDILSGVVFVDDATATPVDLDEQEEALLLPNTSASPTRRSSSRRSYSKSSITSARSSMCYRVHAYITRNWYLNYLVPLSILLALMIVAYLTRDYAKRLLFWIETQNPWMIFAIFMLLFAIVSFPVVVGYFVLMITSGYLFGFFKGLLTVILGANVGIALAHVTIRGLRHRIPLHRLIKNETGRAILRVISGPRAFRVVLFTRLTPIPFGLQNAIFGVSTINPRTYHAATFIGLLPAQIINVYLGSTLRSMHEVLNSHGTAVTGYISFGIEVVCGVALMFWVVQKARKELSETLLTCSPERKIIDIQV